MKYKFVEDSFILSFFYKKEIRPLYKILSSVLLFLVLPTTLVILAKFDNVFLDTLNTKDKFAFTEDYLIMFAFILTPLVFFSLNSVLKRYIRFIEDIPNFTNLKVGSDAHKDILDLNYKLVVNFAKSRYFKILKLVILIIALASSIRTIILRTGGWNSLENPYEFSIIFVYLVVIFSFIVDMTIKYLLMIYSEIRICKELNKQNAFVVRPLAPDKAGGLMNLGKLSLAFTLFVLPFMVVAVVHYFTNGLNFGMLLGMSALIPLTVFVFFVPLSVVHDVMGESKRKTLHNISEKYAIVSARFLDENIKDSNSSIEDSEMLEVLNNLYEKADNMPVWPFNIKMLISFSSTISIPILIFIIDMITNTDSIIYNINKLEIFGNLFK